MNGAKNAPRRDAFVYTIHRGEDAASPTVKALRTDRHKLIFNLNPADRTELYDLKQDPGEMKNLAGPAHASLIEELKAKMLAEMKRLEDPAMAAVQAAK